MKHQKLPYFEATSWTPMNMQEIFNRNYTSSKKYRPDLLPTVEHPTKPFDETRNTRENFEAYIQHGSLPGGSSYVPVRHLRVRRGHGHHVPG